MGKRVALSICQCQIHIKEYAHFRTVYVLKNKTPCMFLKIRMQISRSLDRYPRPLNLGWQSFWEQMSIFIGELDSHVPHALTSSTHTYSVAQRTKHAAKSKKVWVLGEKLTLPWPSPSAWKNDAEDNKMPSGRGCPRWFMCKHDSIALTLVIKFDHMSHKASSFPVRPGLAGLRWCKDMDAILFFFCVSGKNGKYRGNATLPAHKKT